MNTLPVSNRTSNSPAGVRWLRPFVSKPFARLRLYCFPYAGGDALTIYRKWPQILPATVEVCPVQIPGRGTRLLESPLTNLMAIVESIGKDLKDYLDKPF